MTSRIKKSKGKIEKIKFGTHKAEIDRIWEGKPPDKLIQKWKEQGLRGNHPERYYNPGSMLARINRIKPLVGYGSNLVGYCSCCRNLNTHLLKQKVEGAIILTRFCTEHVPDMI